MGDGVAAMEHAPHGAVTTQDGRVVIPPGDVDIRNEDLVAVRSSLRNDLAVLFDMDCSLCVLKNLIIEGHSAFRMQRVVKRKYPTNAERPLACLICD